MHSIEAEDEILESKPLRIGMFSESFDPVQNGVTTSVLTLVAGLRARHHHVCIFAPAHENQRKDEALVLRFPSFVSSFNPNYPVAFPFLPRITLSTHIQNLRLDVVHTHTPFVLGLTGARLAIRRKIPLVTTFHTLYTHYSHYMPILPESVTHSLIERYLPWYYNRCTEIICPSSVAMQALRDIGVTRPIEIIPTGIPLPKRECVDSEAKKSIRSQYNIAQDCPLLLYVGRISAEKNLKWLLEIFHIIHSNIPSAVLVLAGNGPDAEDLQAQALAMLPSEAVKFLGPVQRQNIDSLYAAADVFCFPSPSETQGLVISEARAAGTPVVVVNAGGAPESVREGIDGFRISEGNTRQFASRVISILNTPTLAERLRMNALNAARSQTPDKMVQRVLEVYSRARMHTQDDSFTNSYLEEDVEWDDEDGSVLTTAH